MNLIRCLAAKAVWTLFLLLALAAPPVLANPVHGHGHVGTMSGAMEVVVSGEEIRVLLTFTNHSPRVVWMEKLDEGQAPLRSEFEIRNGEGRMMPYLGPMAKRPAFVKADFFALEPGRSFRREIRIDDRYDFPEGQGDYRMTFSYPSWNERTREAVYRTLPSAKFTYSR
jgi:hypothetical protein